MYTAYNETLYVFICMKNKYINKKKCQTNDRIQVPTHNIGMHTDRWFVFYYCVLENRQSQRGIIDQYIGTYIMGHIINVKSTVASCRKQDFC